MNEFIKYLQEKDLSKTTQKAYLRNVNNFLNWYKSDPINTEKKDILKYLSYLKTKKKQQNITRRNALISLNHYFTFLKETEQIAVNPTNLLKIRGTKKRQLYNIFSFEELGQLVDDYYHTFIRTYDNSHIPKNQRQIAFLNKQRNYGMLTLLVYQGIATNELQNITLSDLDLIKATVRITKGKKSNERIIPLKAEQIGVLMNYTQNIRPQFLEFYGIESDRLFLPLPESGKKQTKSTNLMGTLKLFTRQVRTLNENFLNFKQIRASVITHWIKTKGLRKTQYLAGHRYISSTEKYLPNDLEQLTDDIEKFNPFSF